MNDYTVRLLCLDGRKFSYIDRAGHASPQEAMANAERVFGQGYQALSAEETRLSEERRKRKEGDHAPQP